MSLLRRGNGKGRNRLQPLEADPDDDEDSESSSEDGEDYNMREEPQEAPDLYRNSALGM